MPVYSLKVYGFGIFWPTITLRKTQYLLFSVLKPAHGDFNTAFLKWLWYFNNTIFFLYCGNITLFNVSNCNAFSCPCGALLLCTLHRSIIWGAIFQQTVALCYKCSWWVVLPWNRTRGPRGFFRVNTVAVQWSQWNPNPILLSPVSPAPPQRSDFQSQLLVPKKHGTYRALADCLPEAILSLAGFLFGKVNFVISLQLIWPNTESHACGQQIAFNPQLWGFYFF